MILYFISILVLIYSLYFISRNNILYYEPNTTPTSTPSSTTTPSTIPDSDMELMNLLNKHRTEDLKLEPIPINNDAWKVAITHNQDLSTNNTGWSGRGQSGCSAHSWSNQPGKWTGCCYDLSKPDGNCMWIKPKEITGNTRRGYEIGSGGGKRGASDALKMWLDSAPHKAVIENTGMWANKKWSGFGCSIAYNQQGCWFLD